MVGSVKTSRIGRLKSKDAACGTGSVISSTCLAGGADYLVNLVPVHVRLLPERLRHGYERGRDGGTDGWVLAQQAEAGNRVLALHLTRERLRIRLNQAWGDELGAATSIQPLPRLAVDQVSTERFTITLNLRKIIR